ncbi:MAG: transposase [Deltaproteobacteria bacterium]|nr:transposase [Deltaproteobacteria bacterium]
MPRQPRLDAPGTLHHAMGRGIEKIKIFRNKNDQEDFISRIAELCSQKAWIVYAWALLSNHFHILVRTENQPLPTNMRRLLTGYVINFNRRHKRYGHLFQNRYKSIICEDDPYLLELTRYIHLNPLRAGIVTNKQELDTYPWTGHSAIIGKIKRGWQDSDTILAYFGRRKREAIIGYSRFVEQGITQGKRKELVGGGLIRSIGGWSQVLALRRKGEKVASDQRILGGSEFVKILLKEGNKQEKESLRFTTKKPDLASLAKHISRNEGIMESELKSGSRRRKISKARRLFCQLSVGKMGCPGAQVARLLGVSTSAVIRAAHSEELPEVGNYL